VRYLNWPLVITLFVNALAQSLIWGESIGLSDLMLAQLAALGFCSLVKAGAYDQLDDWRFFVPLAMILMIPIAFMSFSSEWPTQLILGTLLNLTILRIAFLETMKQESIKDYPYKSLWAVSFFALLMFFDLRFLQFSKNSVAMVFLISTYTLYLSQLSRKKLLQALSLSGVSNVQTKKTPVSSAKPKKRAPRARISPSQSV
jgi:hypothetical protein